MADPKPRIIAQGAARRNGDERPGWLPLRGPSGRLYGYLDPQTQTIEVKHGGQQAERIELRALLQVRQS